MGEPADWWNLIAATKYLGVPPWDLACQPVWWIDVAVMAANAESHAQEQRNRHR